MEGGNGSHVTRIGPARSVIRKLRRFGDGRIRNMRIATPMPAPFSYRMHGHA
jgi:hypothetical protein